MLIIDRIDQLEKNMFKVLAEIKTLLDKRTKNEIEYLTSREVSLFTKLSESTIRRAILDKKLSPSRSTGKLLFKKSEVIDWLQK